MNISALLHSKADFESFEQSASSKEQKEELARFREPILANKIHIYVAEQNAAAFDLTVDLLSDSFLYSEELIPVIYTFYNTRKLYEVAADYRSRASTYFAKNGFPVPHHIQSIFNELASTALLNAYKTTFSAIRSLSYNDIPFVTPDIINEQNSLNEFILAEILSAANILLDKIRSVDAIADEDRYNDLMVATLRLRLPFYGWTVKDQPRTGTSAGGVNPGEIDILFDAGGTPIAFIEAFLLRSKDKTKTEAHLMKVEDYIAYLTRYYIVVYYLGSPSNFDNAWAGYCTDVLATPFPSTLAITKGFTDISAHYNNVRRFKVAETQHKGGATMYHVMIDFNQRTVP